MSFEATLRCVILNESLWFRASRAVAFLADKPPGACVAHVYGMFGRSVRGTCAFNNDKHAESDRMADRVTAVSTKPDFPHRLFDWHGRTRLEQVLTKTGNTSNMSPIMCNALHKEVSHRLRDLIVSWRQRPSERIQWVEVAQLLGGRTPVREAIVVQRQLHPGKLECRHGRTRADDSGLGCSGRSGPVAHHGRTHPEHLAAHQGCGELRLPLPLSAGGLSRICQACGSVPANLVA